MTPIGALSVCPWSPGCLDPSIFLVPSVHSLLARQVPRIACANTTLRSLQLHLGRLRPSYWSLLLTTLHQVSLMHQPSPRPGKSRKVGTRLNMSWFSTSGPLARAQALHIAACCAVQGLARTQPTYRQRSLHWNIAQPTSYFTAVKQCKRLGGSDHCSSDFYFDVSQPWTRQLANQQLTCAVQVHPQAAVEAHHTNLQITQKLQPSCISLCVSANCCALQNHAVNSPSTQQQHIQQCTSSHHEPPTHATGVRVCALRKWVPAAAANYS